MKNTVSSHFIPEYISYYHQLDIIGSIRFTPREIDVIACLLSGKGNKTIAHILSIEEATVSTHKYNIMRKLECNSKEGIIHFIERSEKFSVLNHHYISLLRESIFKKHLHQILGLCGNKDILCLLIYEQKNNNKAFLTNQLEKHLKCAGLKIEKKTLENGGSFLDYASTKKIDYIIYIISHSFIQKISEEDSREKQELSELIEKKNKEQQKIIFLLASEEQPLYIPQEIKNTGFIDLQAHENYYISFFEILKIIFSDIVLDTNILEYKEQYNKDFEKSFFPTEAKDLSSTSLSIEDNTLDRSNTENKIYYNILSGFFKKIEIKLYIVLILFLIVLVREITMSNRDAAFLIDYLQNCSVVVLTCFTLAFCFIAISILYKHLQIEGLYLYNAIVMLIANLYYLNSELTSMLISSTFFINNVLTEFYGRKTSQTSVLFTVYTQLFITLFILLALGYESPTDMNIQNYMTHLLSLKTFTASLIAIILSQPLNSLFFEYLPHKIGTFNLWLRTSCCLLVIGPIDHFIFSYLEFSFFTKEPMRLWDILTGHVLVPYSNHILFIIASIIMCKFFYSKKKEDTLRKHSKPGGIDENQEVTLPTS